MAMKLNILGAFMEDMVVSYVQGRLIITKDHSWFSVGNLEITKKIQKYYCISKTVVTIARYSASAEDLEIVGCFLDFQDTRESPRTSCPTEIGICFEIKRRGSREK